MAATTRARLQEDMRRAVKGGQFNETGLLEHLAVARSDGSVSGAEARKALNELLTSGELIARYIAPGNKAKCSTSKRVLCLTADVRTSEPPIVLKPRLDMSRRIYQALFTYRRLEAEVSRDELKALCKQVYTIERFTLADYEVHFAHGLERALAAGKIERVDVEGPAASSLIKYRSGARRKELLVCALCANADPSDHTRKLECRNCRWQRHASCMGLRKHRITHEFECELCADCEDCKLPPSAWNPLAWCPTCFRPKHLRPCAEQGEQPAPEQPGSGPRRATLVNQCTACGGNQLVEQRPQPPTTPKKETESFSPSSPLAPTCSSASSSATMAHTPGSSEKSVAGKLSDSLSAYFTPQCEGRRRHVTINTHEDSTSDDEPLLGGDRGAARHMHPLTVEVSCESGGSGMASKTPPSSSSSHHHHRRAEQQLHDALSPYFSLAASAGKRRSAVKGEYARMQGGGGQATAIGGGLLSPGPGPGPSSSSAHHHHHQHQGTMMASVPLSGGLLTPKRSRGRPPRNPSLIGSPPSSSAKEEEEEEEEEGGETSKTKMTAASSSRKSTGGGRSSSPSKKNRAGGGEESAQWRLGRSTQNSAAAALFTPADDERRRTGKGAGRRDSESDGGPRRTAKSSRVLSSASASTSAAAAVASPSTPKSPLHKRLKREIRSSDKDTSQLDSEDSDDKPLMRRAGVSLRTPSSSSALGTAAMATPSTSTAGGTASEKKNSKKRKDEPLKSVSRKDAVRTQSPIDSTGTGAGSSITGGFEMSCGDVKITAEQWAGYEACSRKANEGIEKTELLTADGSEIPRWPETICFGRFEMETWFTAPYPSEFSHTKRLFICEYCLKYMRTLPQLIRHAKKCEQWHPPGNEIYRKDNVSVFEVDGNVAGMYCQNLCLLAKLYLDHKTLYYDVEPFLFYIVTKNDERGCHFVGYFSKEKYSAQKFNLSCIVTLPAYHKQGYGRFLIDFSYLLTRREKMFGTPERPLSDLGRVSYAAYWKSALLEYLRKKIKIEKKTDFRLSEIAVDTGISLYDAVEVMEALGMLVTNENTGNTEFLYKEDLVEAHWKKAQANKERIWIDEKALEWSPVQHTPTKDFNAHLRSPPRVVSPTPSSHGITPSGVPVAACGSTIKRGPLAAANAGQAGAAASDAAGATSPTRKMTLSTAPSAARMSEKKKATRQLKLTDCGVISSPKATSTPARKSRRQIAAASEDSSLASTSSEDEKKPETKSTCKSDTTKRRNRRSEDSDSSDEERDGGGATPKKRPTAPPPAPSSSSNGRRASGASRNGAAPPSSPPKSRKRGAGSRRDSDDDEEGEVSSTYATTSSSSDSDSDADTSFRPQIGRRPAPSKGKKGSKGVKPTPNIPRKACKAAPQKGGGKKNGVTTVATVSSTSSPPQTVMVNSKKKEMKSPGKVFPSNYLQTIAARKQQVAAAAAAAAESAAAPSAWNSMAGITVADHELAAAVGTGEEEGRPASPADSLCSTATIPMRQAPEAADQSMMTDDAHESEGRANTPGPSASAMSSRPSSSVRGRKMDRRKNGRTRKDSSDEQSDSSIDGSSSGSSLFRGTSPRPMGDRVPSTSAGGTMNMGWDEEETDHDRTLRMEQMEQMMNAAPPASSSSSERPPSLQAMTPIEQRQPEEPPHPTLGSLLSHEMAKGGVAASTASVLPPLSQSRKQSAAVSTTPQAPMMNGACKPGPSCISSSSSSIPLIASSAAAASSTDDSEDDAPPCLSPQYARGEGECAAEGGAAAGGSGGVGGGASSSRDDDGGASSDASATAPILAPSNATRSMSLDHTPSASSTSSSSAVIHSNHGGLMGGRRISEQQQQSCAIAAAATAAYDPFNSPPKAPLPHADQLLRPAIDVGVSHQELNFGMAAHSLHGRLSGGEGGPGPPSLQGGPPGSAHSAQTSPLLHQQQQQQMATQNMMMQQQHGTPQMMAYPGSASGGGMQSTPSSVPSSAHNTPESAVMQQTQTTPLMQQQQQQMQQMQQQFTSPTMQQQMYSQQPSSVHSTNSGHHDMSGGGAGPGSVPAGYGLQMHQGGHSNPSTPLRAMGGPGSANQPPFNSPTPMPQPLSVPDHHAAVAAAAAAASSTVPSIAGRRSSEAATVGPPTAAVAAAAATKKRSSAGAAPPLLPSPLAAQQQHHHQQQQQAQQYQMMQQMMAMQNMQQHMFPMFPNQMVNGYNGYAQWPAGAAAQFQQMAYPTGMMQVPVAGKNGMTSSSSVANVAAAAASLYPQYPAAAMQQMHQQPMQQQQQQQSQQQQQQRAVAAATAQWQRTPAFGPPFTGVSGAAAPDAGNFVLNGALPAMQYFSQQAHPAFPQQY